jgi:holo-[acyl-carrier-protein] synthase
MNPLMAPEARPHARAGTALSVNVNKVALLRNTRHLGIPSVLRAATLALQAGADGITVHPRPDGRHIRPHDVTELAELLMQWPQAEYNIEGNPFHNLMDFVRAVRPRPQATFVPDSEGQFTSDHGWDLAADGARLRPLIDECHALGVRVSLFMDPTARRWPARARSVPTASSSTPSPTPRPRHAAQAAAAAALRRRRARRAGSRPGRQRRARPQPRQPDRLPARRAGRDGGLDRPRAGRRRARARAGRDRARLPALHPARRRTLRRRRRRRDDLRHRHRPVRHAAHRATLARRGDRFAEKVLGPREIEVFHARRARVQARGVRYLATRFSAKEAFSKAIGLGIRMPMTWRACEILNEPAAGPTSASAAAGRVVRRAAPARACHRQRRDRLRELRSSSSKPWILHHAAHSPVVLDIAGTTLNADDRRRLKHPLTGGLILFARNWHEPRAAHRAGAEVKSLRPTC